MMYIVNVPVDKYQLAFFKYAVESRMIIDSLITHDYYQCYLNNCNKVMKCEEDLVTHVRTHFTKAGCIEILDDSTSCPLCLEMHPGMTLTEHCLATRDRDHVVSTWLIPELRANTTSGIGAPAHASVVPGSAPTLATSCDRGPFPDPTSARSLATSSTTTDSNSSSENSVNTTTSNEKSEPETTGGCDTCGKTEECETPESLEDRVYTACAMNGQLWHQKSLYDRQCRMAGRFDDQIGLYPEILKAEMRLVHV